MDQVFRRWSDDKAVRWMSTDIPDFRVLLVSKSAVNLKEHFSCQSWRNVNWQTKYLDLEKKNSESLFVTENEIVPKVLSSFVFQMEYFSIV